MTDISIDINADLGEFEESLANGTAFELMRYITSANVACGGHAGNEQSMRQTLCGAREDCGVPGHAASAREAARRVISRSQHEPRGCARNRPRRESDQSPARHGRPGRLVCSGSLAFHGIAIRCRSLR